MKYFFCFIIILNFCFGETLRLAMAIYPPYAYVESNQYSGFGYKRVIQILTDAEIQFEIYDVPNYGRAFKDTTTGRADGFFLASQNDERDKIAILSNPISQSSWVWIIDAYSNININNKHIFKEIAKVGVQLNSNLYIWLKDNDFEIVATPSDITVLIDFLESKRVNAIFLPKIVALEILNKKGFDSNNYIIKEEKTENLGIYISKEYLKRNYDILEKINYSIEKNIEKEDLMKFKE